MSATTVYTVRRSPYTAAAKRSAGYGSVDFEYVADTAREAISKAVAECEWRDPERNFTFRVTGSRVLAPVVQSTEDKESDR